MEITITINRADTENWLNPDDNQDEAQVSQWAEQYAEALAAKMAEFNEGADVNVEWGNGLASGYSIAVDGMDDWEDEHNALAELELDYQAVTDELTRFEWMS